MSNLDEIVEKIKEFAENPERISWKVPDDNYKKYLVQSVSNYEKEKKNMKKIRAKQKFQDMFHNNCLRKPGKDEWIEENDRADDLINRGFAVLVEEIKTETKPAKKKEEPILEEGIDKSPETETAMKKTKRVTKAKTTEKTTKKE